MWRVLCYTFCIICLFLVKPRNDALLAAIDKEHYIKLYEKDNDFELNTDGDNAFKGTYTMSMDTVFLVYNEKIGISSRNFIDDPLKYDDRLTTTLVIDKRASIIKSIDGTSFDATIYLDKREKVQQDTILTINEMTSQDTQGSINKRATYIWLKIK